MMRVIVSYDISTIWGRLVPAGACSVAVMAVFLSDSAQLRALVLLGREPSGRQRGLYPLVNRGPL